MGEDREWLDTESDEVEGHSLPEGQVDPEREVLQDDDVEGHSLISENLPDSNLEP